jgi:hypothetical protein
VQLHCINGATPSSGVKTQIPTKIVTKKSRVQSLEAKTSNLWGIPLLSVFARTSSYVILVNIGMEPHQNASKNTQNYERIQGEGCQVREELTTVNVQPKLVGSAIPPSPPSPSFSLHEQRLRVTWMRKDSRRWGWGQGRAKSREYEGAEPLFSVD